jgi:hypothetical protein
MEFMVSKVEMEQAFLKVSLLLHSPVSIGPQILHTDSVMTHATMSVTDRII